MPSDISLCPTVSAVCTSVTDRQTDRRTDRPRYGKIDRSRRNSFQRCARKIMIIIATNRHRQLTKLTFLWMSSCFSSKCFCFSWRCSSEKQLQMLYGQRRTRHARDNTALIGAHLAHLSPSLATPLLSPGS